MIERLEHVTDEQEGKIKVLREQSIKNEEELILKQQKVNVLNNVVAFADKERASLYKQLLELKEDRVRNKILILIIMISSY